MVDASFLSQCSFSWSNFRLYSMISFRLCTELCYFAGDNFHWLVQIENSFISELIRLSCRSIIFSDRIDCFYMLMHVVPVLMVLWTTPELHRKLANTNVIVTLIISLCRRTTTCIQWAEFISSFYELRTFKWQEKAPMNSLVLILRDAHCAVVTAIVILCDTWYSTQVSLLPSSERAVGSQQSDFQTRQFHVFICINLSAGRSLKDPHLSVSAQLGQRSLVWVFLVAN